MKIQDTTTDLVSCVQTVFCLRLVSCLSRRTISYQSICYDNSQFPDTGQKDTTRNLRKPRISSISDKSLIGRVVWGFYGDKRKLNSLQVLRHNRDRGGSTDRNDSSKIVGHGHSTLLLMAVLDMPIQLLSIDITSKIIGFSGLSVITLIMFNTGHTRCLSKPGTQVTVCLQTYLSTWHHPVFR